MSDDIQFGVNPEGEDRINRLTKSVDQLTASLVRMADNPGITKLKQQVDALQGSVSTGFAEIRMKMQDHNRRVESEMERSASAQLRKQQQAAERQMALERKVQLDRMNFLAQTLERQAAIEEKAEATSWQNMLAMEAKKAAAQKKADDARLAQTEAAARQRVAVEERAAAASWQNMLALEAKKTSQMERQRQLDAKFLTSPLKTQISTAEQAAVYASLGGDSTKRFGAAAATADIAALRAQYALLKGPIDSSTKAIAGHNHAMQEAHALARGLAGSLGSLWLTYGSLVPLAAGAALASSLKSVVSVGREVEYQLSFVAALSKEAVPLDQFLHISDGSIQSVRETAEGMRILAQNGLSVKESLAALPEVLQLATVGELAVEEAAFAATGALAAYELQIGDLAHVNDVLVKTAASSNTSVKALTESFKQASTTASIYKVSLEETSAALGVLAKVNIIGSAAGTAYTNMLTGLYAPTNEGKKALEELGVSATTASGQLKNASDLLGELRSKLAGYSEEARSSFLGDIFTQRGAKSAGVLMQFFDTYTQRVQELKNASGDTAAAVLELEDNVTGAFKRLRNSADQTFSRAFSQISPAIQETVDALAGIARSEGAVDLLARLGDMAVSTTKFIIDHGQAILTLIGIYAALKTVSSTWLAISAAIRTYVAAATGAQTATMSLTAAVQAYNTAAVAGQVAATGLAAATRLAVGVLGPLALAIGAATLAYQAMNREIDTVEKQDTKLRNSIQLNIESLEREIKALEERRRLRVEGAGETDELPDAVQARRNAEADLELARQVYDQKRKSTLLGVADISDYAPVLKARKALEEAKRNEMKITALQEERDDRARIERDATEKQRAEEQIKRFIERGKLLETSKGEKFTAEPVNQEFLQATRQAEPLLEQLRAGTISAGQAMIDLKKLEIEGASGLAGRAAKQDNDTIAATIKQIELKKQLAEIEGRTDTAKLEADRAAGRVGELEYLRRKLELEKDALATAALVAAEEANVVKDAEKKQTALEKYRNLAITAAAKSKQLEVQAAIEAQAYIDGLRVKNLESDAELYERKGNLVDAFLAKFQAQYGREIERLQKDLSGVDVDALEEALFVDPSNTATLKAYNTAMEQTVRLRNLLKQQGAGTDNAVFTEAKSKFDAQLASLRESLEEAKAAAGEDGLAGQLRLGETAKQLHDNVLPQVTALADELERMAAQKDAPAEFVKAASEAGRAAAKVQQELTKSANPFGAAWKGVWDGFEKSAHDAWMNFGKDGESILTKLKNTLRTGLMEMIYQMTIKPIVIQFAQSFMGGGAGGTGFQGLMNLLGSSSYSGQGGIGGALGSLGNIVGLGKNIFGMVGGGFSASMGSLVSGFGNLIGSQTISAYGTGMGLTTAQAATAAGQYGAGSAVGGSLMGGASAGTYAIPIAGWIAAGMALANGLYKQGWDANNGSINTLGKVVNAPMLGLNKLLQGIGLSNSMANIISGASTISALFGRKNPEITSRGVQGIVGEAGTTGEAFQNWLAKGGLFRSDKTGTQTSALDTDLQNYLTSSFTQIKTLTEGFAKSLSVSSDSLQGFTETFRFELGTDQAENQKVFTEYLGALADTMARRVLPNIAEFTKLGETAGQTLERLATNFQATTTIAQLLGKTAEQAFGAAGFASIAAREQFVNLSGGIQELSANVASYAQNYLTEAEKAAPVLATLEAAFKDLGVVAPTTRNEFKALVSGLDLTNAEQVKMFNSLMALQDAFAQVHPQIEAVGDAIVKTAQQIADERKSLQEQLDQFLPEDELLAKQRAALDESNRSLFDQIQAHKDLQEAYESEAEALQSAVSRNQQFATSLRSFRDQLTLGDLSTLTPLQKYAEARRQFMETLTKARAGDETAQGNFTQAAQAFLEASRVANASDPQYTADFNMVRSATEETARWAEQQVDIGKSSLEQLKLQVSGLVRIETAIGTVGQALLALAQAGGAMGPNQIPTIIDTLYRQILGRQADTSGRNFWVDQYTSGVPLQDITTSMQNSPEAVIRNLYTSLLNRAPDQSGLQFWTQQYTSGVSLDAITQAFMSSPEYQTMRPQQPYETASGVPTVEMLSKLVASVDALRLEQQQQSTDQINATLTAATANAEMVVDGTEQALHNAAYAASNEPLVPQ